MSGEKKTEIRRMRESDIDEVYRIEQDLFPVPWPRRSFVFEVGNSPTTYAIVLTEDEMIAGYAISWFLGEELHIGNVAVRRDRQGTGIGRDLIENMMSEASTRGASFITLEVRASNVKAIGLYRSYGFKGIAIRRQYYTDNGEDALVMMMELEKGNAGVGP